MRLARFALLLAAGLLVAACSSGGGATTALSSAAPSPTVQSSAAPSATTPEPSASVSAEPAAVARIEVQLTDALRIEPAEMRVPAGVTVTFVVTNTGKVEHEFFLGDEKAQAAHEQEMQEMGMGHDEAMGISVPAGETKELTVTFPEPGSMLAGCHLPGHYAGGMVATVTIED
ncbi:MAG TPA: plastocyanin/azurin family copper-binding protein [Candidatus Limnocylindrales bacterium]|nr:plastocyanin/azurin family copper-binding protein [Candidatus Limnocylindrales bacterium]